ncbi:hypothetical protein [Paraburkholderia hospita]|uniref:hypothetical protein n=1 Tax=Paraburkholderia hospita TaxID=169430 RepID=UPI003F506F1F
MRRVTWNGITLREGMHLWSNLALRDTPAAVPAIIASPTFLDLVLLSMRYPLAHLEAVNDQLFADGEISALRHERTARTLETIRTAGDAR